MKNIISLVLLLFLMSCQDKINVDLIIHNAKIYTVDSVFSIQEAMAVKNGKIEILGSTEDILKNYESPTTIDFKGKYVYPGFNDAHAHLYGLGQNLNQVNLFETKSFEDIVKRIQEFQDINKLDFIVGRGWDQNDWLDKSFPTKDTLDLLYPNTPIALTRIDGHAMLVNQKALDLAQINPDTKVDGGEIKKVDGQLTGVLIDNPMSKIKTIIPPLSNEEIKQALQKAQDIVLQNGLTSLTDAGLPKNVIEIIQKMQEEGELKIRINAMVSNNIEDINYFVNKGIIKTPRLRVGSVKVYADGALGSRGAALKEPYSDKANHFGAMVISLKDFDQLAKKLSQTEFQMNTHAIGDSANAVVLKTYNKYLNEKPNRRWRVEHAQVLDPNEYQYFSKNIIPSVQPTHATSDMYWAEDRLGKERIKHAYAYKNLLNQAGILPLGTDFPVEKVNPLLTFYAAVSRQDTKAYPEDGFQSQNALSRKETLKGMTIWAAYAAFEEDIKGSLEQGKFADFVVFNKDLMSMPIYEIPNLKVQHTFINGEEVYQAE